ncbi:FAD-dependent oxidoreductase [Pseudoroseomonas deserti]|uniref:FAD-dependent oxidoreductase n=1 Tax=Teichococcus deserti TaxID=1817963 RepID=A0A1V2H0W3_9PROT|nr:FAD-binding oxidoreductase [Pseudoroseomonas deserti]ONG51797.1 FAD-dependent oxidoreductase [Pseudoroseomonas deserti]
MTDLLPALAAIVGPAHVIAPGHDQAPFVTDWRGRYHGRAEAVVRPADAAQVSEVVKLCVSQGVAVVPQGGNTGMCGAAVPPTEGRAVVLRLDRLNRIRWVSSLGDAIAVDAGCILAEIQQAAERIDRLFPLSLGAEGSCQIGGNLSTNAGGTQVLRYGTMRELCLGLEVVLPDGRLLETMTALRKDSTGYDIKQMFIGAEGTLGIITGAVLKLFPRPRASAVAMGMAENFEQVQALLALARSRLGDRLSSFEAMSRRQVEVIARHMPQVAIPFSLEAGWYVLVELSDTLEGDSLPALLEAMLGEALEKELVMDAIVASSQAQAEGLWRIRHSVSESSKAEGYVVSHDSVVPLERQADFIRGVEQAIEAVSPGATVVMHGHVGDGNMHVLAILDPKAFDDAAALQDRAAAISLAVDGVLVPLGGAISAEHGIGLSNRARLARAAPPLELELMRRFKDLLDPQGLMNPGKILI